MPIGFRTVGELAEQNATKPRHPRGLKPIFSSMGWREMFSPEKLLWLQITEASYVAGRHGNTVTATLGRLDQHFQTDPPQQTNLLGLYDIRRYVNDSPITEADAGFGIFAEFHTGNLNVLVDLSIVSDLRFNLRGCVQYKHRRVER